MEKSGDIPEGTTDQWMKETKNFKKLPERVKEAMLDLTPHFTKIAIELFDPAKNPIVPSHVTQQQAIEQAKEEKTIPKAAKPNASRTVNPEDNRVKSAKEMFKKSGNWKDAAKLLSIN